MREKKNRWLYLIFLLTVIMLIIIGVSFLYLKDTKREIPEPPKQEVKKENLNEKEELEQKEEIEEKNIEPIIEEEKNEQEVSKNEETSSQKKDSNISSQNNSNKNSNSSNNQTTSQTKPPVEKTEWEKLGLSEYDYYHSPAWKWQEVDFGIYLSDDKKCTNEVDCQKKCQSYGNEYLKEHDGGYKCNGVNNHAGSYIGEDFEFFELQP